MERGEDLLNTAILLRTNQESEGLINVLMEYQVPFTMKEQLPNLFPPLDLPGASGLS